MTGQVSPAVTQYLASLSAERRLELGQVRDVIVRNLPSGYEEALAGKILVYQVPLARYPDTYNGRPLWYVALASQKNYLSLYLMSAYGDSAHAQQLREGFKAAGKKLHMGKSCIRFRTAADLPLDVIGKLIGRMPVDRWVEIAKSARRKA
jgi:hypothetical protein